MYKILTDADQDLINEEKRKLHRLYELENLAIMQQKMIQGRIVQDVNKRAKEAQLVLNWVAFNEARTSKPIPEPPLTIEQYKHELQMSKSVSW
jgi:hypothetical protein